MGNAASPGSGRDLRNRSRGTPCATTQAMAFAASNGDPPPIPTTKSHPSRRATSHPI